MTTSLYICVCLLGQVQQEQPKDMNPKISTVQDAVRWVHDDLMAMREPLDHPFTRWIWFPENKKEYLQGTSFVINNNLSWAEEPYTPVPVAGGYLLRVDVREMWPRDEDLKRGLRVWEQLPNWTFGRRTEKKTLITVPAYVAADGKTYTKKWQNEVIDSKFSLHSGLDKYLFILARTQTSVPIIRYDQFCIYANRTLNGGLYYKFNGFDDPPPKGKTQLVALLERFGDFTGKVDSDRADDRAAMTDSGVSSRERLIVIKPSQGVRPSRGNGIIALTFDIAEGDDLSEQNPLANLIKFKFTAGEGILQRPNGGLVFILYDNKETILDKVDDAIAHDGTIPFPYRNTLEPSHSCLRCHGVDDGYKPYRNDVRLLWDRGLATYGDEASKLPYWETLDLLRGRFSATPPSSKTPFAPINIARNFYSDMVFRCTGGLSIPQACSSVSNVFTRYLYTGVDAAMACEEVAGIKVSQEEGVAAFDKLVPELPLNELGFSPEDPNVGFLRAGATIRRNRFEAVFADISLRAEAERIRLQGQNPPVEVKQ